MAAAIHFGFAEVISVMLAHEPRLLSDLNHGPSLAAAKGHSKLAALIASIVEGTALSVHLSQPPMAKPPAPRRL